MPFIELPGDIKVGVTPEDITAAIKLIFSGAEPHIKYDLGFLKGFYANETNWLAARGIRGYVTAPYQMLFDYRKSKMLGEWGRCTVHEPYELPNELYSHQRAMVDRFTKVGKLYKGNLPCVRVFDIYEGTDGLPELKIQQAFYTDQVATNLTPDEEIHLPRHSGGTQVPRSVRVWDAEQAECVGTLPPFSQSKLANTIGIAVGVTAPDSSGRYRVVRRRRSKKTMIYEGQWHVPLSFALAWPETLKVGDSVSLEKLIRPDFCHEFGEELRGLEISDFEPVRPLALCRDLVRAGKPQLFFEMRSRLSIEEMEARLKSNTREYRGRLKESDSKSSALSPELVAFSMLIDMESISA